MHDPASESDRWMEQAADDVEFAGHALAGGYNHQACFVCQQASEKALKALLYRDGARTVLGHSLISLLDRIVAAHPSLERLRSPAAVLDLYYVPTRYPNGLVEGTPRRAFTRQQAEEAIRHAGDILDAVRAEIAR